MRNKLFYTILGMLIGIFLAAPFAILATSQSFIDGKPYRFEGNSAVFVYSAQNGFKQLYSEQEYIDTYGSKDWSLIKKIGITGDRYGKYFGSLQQCEAEYEKETAKKEARVCGEKVVKESGKWFNSIQQCEAKYDEELTKANDIIKNSYRKGDIDLFIRGLMLILDNAKAKVEENNKSEQLRVLNCLSEPTPENLRYLSPADQDYLRKVKCGTRTSLDGIEYQLGKIKDILNDWKFKTTRGF